MIDRLKTVRHRLLSTGEGRLLIAAVTTLLTGTIFYARVEGWSVIDSLYFCVVTLTTIGYGDLHPTRDLSKLFTIGYIVTGLGLLAALINLVGERRTASARRKAAQFAETTRASQERDDARTSSIDGE